MPLFVGKKPFVRTKGKGKTQIVRDGYSNVKGSWYSTIDKIQTADKQQCVQCGISAKDAKARDGKGLETHHRVPLSKGGRTTAMNLLTLCHACHEKKHKHKF